MKTNPHLIYLFQQELITGSTVIITTEL